MIKLFFVVTYLGTFLPSFQCDQIWQNFPTLAKFKKSLAISWLTILYLAKLWTYFGRYFILLGKFSLFLLVKYWKIIKCHLVTLLPSFLRSYLQGRARLLIHCRRKKKNFLYKKIEEEGALRRTEWDKEKSHPPPNNRAPSLQFFVVVGSQVSAGYFAIGGRLNSKASHLGRSQVRGKSGT